MHNCTISNLKIVANAVGGTICYILFYTWQKNHTLISSLQFLFLAVNCTFRRFSYLKLIRMKKNVTDKYQYFKARYRQDIIMTIVSTATAMLFLLLLLVHSITQKDHSIPIILFALFTVCFGVFVVLTIQNLRHFDKQ